jgi:DNA repair photolyase
VGARKTDIKSLTLFPDNPERIAGITRKTLLYKSGLGFHCINHVQGCSHGCRYPCYAMMMGQSHGRIKGYEDWCEPKLVANAYELLKKELSRLKTRPESIHLCLSTDPFMTGYPDIIDMSLRLIELINSYGIPVSLLSKGLLPSELADKKRFPASNMHGISLISLDEDFRNRWEPGTTPYAERIRALKYLHEQGRRTRVHMEPYPTPNILKQDLGKILGQLGFVDEIFFGGWNYNRIVKGYKDWKEFYRKEGEVVWKYCSERGILYTGIK